MQLYACPVRLFTPEIEAWLALFHATHEVRPSVGWVRVAFPVAGGVNDQDAKTFEALALIRQVWNGVLRESVPAAARKRRGR